MDEKLPPGRTRICTIPFTNPTIEPNGKFRLCSAASTFGYSTETTMGHMDSGVGNVWNGAKYRAIRTALLTGDDLPVYCHRCEYRHEGPTWVLQLHVALHVYAETGAANVLQMIERMSKYYLSYKRFCIARNLAWGEWPQPLPWPIEDAGQE